MITGYHGTTKKNAHKILDEGKFHLSSSNKEWLGTGIYFYEKFSDAYDWRPTTGEEKTVLHSVIDIEDEEYLDIDLSEGEKTWIKTLEYMEDKNIVLDGTTQENQCAVCKMLWALIPEIKVLAASFATTPSFAKVLIDKRPRRREFCVRSNDAIKCTQIIEYKG